MAQQTAVEFIIQEFLNKKFRTLEGRKEVFEQAKKMEKQQIIDAFDIGTIDDNIIGDEYYNEKYVK